VTVITPLMATPKPTTYTYSIQNDFPNHRVEPTRLSQEIQASSIVTALLRIDTSGDDCNITFTDVLSAADKTTLDGVVAAHSGDPLPSQTQEIFSTLASDKTTTSGVFADLLSIPIITQVNGDSLVIQASVSSTSVFSAVFFQVTLDGTPVAGSGSSHLVGTAGISILARVLGVSARSHTVTLQWRVDGSVPGGSASVSPVTQPDSESATLSVREASP